MHAYRGVAESAWRWVLDQVGWDDGPWIPVSKTDPPATQAAWDRDGMHSGVGGLAYVLAEIRLTRPWTEEEQALASAIAERLRRVVPTQTDCTYFDGLVGSLGVLIALGEDGTELAVARLAELAETDGWPQTIVGPPGYLPGARLSDLTLGTAGVLLGAMWARRQGVAGASQLAESAAEVLLVEQEARPTGVTWPMVPSRFRDHQSRPPEMPNLSHGVAGVAATLGLAAVELDRPDLCAAALRGAEYLVSVGEVSQDGFVAPRYLPRDYNEQDEVTFTWCHGAAGTSLLFLSLHRAGVRRIADEAPLSWHRRCLNSVRTSGLPARLHPGFWDNDGRCCGTAGVGDIVLDSWQRSRDDRDLAFAVRLADALVERSCRHGRHAYWRFIAHDADEPLLPPGVGWMQGASGIAAFLFRIGRVVESGPMSASVPRMDNWWALPDVLTG